jgi:hypothetical protein
MATVAANSPTNAAVLSAPPSPDEPFLDMTAYGAGPNDSITDATENAAITHHVATIGDTTIPYTARAGHLVAVDPSSSQANAKFFLSPSRPMRRTRIRGRSPSSITAGRGHRRCSCCSAPSRRGASRPICPASRRRRLTRSRTIPTASSIAPTSSTSTPSAPAIQRRSHRPKTAISGASIRTRVRSSNSSSAI